MNPRVSVLMSSRNGERYVETALGGIERQTWADLETILVDDGSTDRTGEIMRAYSERHPRVRVLRTPGVGLAGALREAAGFATGSLLARHDDDDVSHPERFRRQVDYLDAHPDVGVLGTAAHMIDEEGSLIGTHDVPHGDRAIRAQLEHGSPFVHGAVMMRRECYEAAGGYRAAFAASQDVDLWLRMPRGTGFANLREPLYSWRSHAGGVFARRRDDQLFFAALARTFARERRRRGADAYGDFSAASRDAFLETYRDRAALFAALGEAYVREGRVAEAREYLVKALSGGAPHALLWWVASFAVALTPRARRHEVPG